MRNLFKKIPKILVVATFLFGGLHFVYADFGQTSDSSVFSNTLTTNATNWIFELNNKATPLVGTINDLSIYLKNITGSSADVEASYTYTDYLISNDVQQSTGSGDFCTVTTFASVAGSFDGIKTKTGCNAVISAPPSGQYRINRLRLKATVASRIEVGGSSNDSSYPYGTCSGTSCGTLKDPYFNAVGTFSFAPYTESFDTHIISLSPSNGSTTPTAIPVHFNLSAYISEDDIGDFLGVSITLHNIDQNVFLLSDLSSSDLVLLDQVQATTSGLFTYSTSTILADGNYRLNAVLEATVFGGLFTNPFSGVLGIIDEQSTQFIVGSSTFIGNISQNSYEQYGNILASTTATSTGALASTCNPLRNNISTAFLNIGNSVSAMDFNPVSCLSFLFIPDAGYTEFVLTNLKENVITHFPFGYLTRFYNVLATSTVIALPEISYTFGSSSPAVLDGKTFSIDVYDYLGSTSPINSIRTDDGEDQSIWDVVDPIFTVMVSIAVLFVIINDLLGLAVHEEHKIQRNLSNKK